MSEPLSCSDASPVDTETGGEVQPVEATVTSIDSASTEESARAEQAEVEQPIESDLAAISNVRELLLGDAIRSIREEVLCNHGILLSRFEALEASTTKRMNVIVKKLVNLSRELDVESSNRSKQLKALHRRLASDDTKIRAELDQVSEQLNEAVTVTRTELDAKLADHARDLIKSESRMKDRLSSDIKKVGAERLKRTDFADSLRAIAAQVNPASDGKPSATGQ